MTKCYHSVSDINIWDGTFSSFLWDIYAENFYVQSLLQYLTIMFEQGLTDSSI